MGSDGVGRRKSRMGESEEWEKYRMEIKIKRHWPIAGNESHEHGI